MSRSSTSPLKKDVDIFFESKFLKYHENVLLSAPESKDDISHQALVLCESRVCASRVAPRLAELASAGFGAQLA